ncbi:MAG: hypothetical protein GC185_10905 [Alphaproteobacteria bacterium]|nr:hypothetical protein [Alphaproteobacteria bacterium]
MTLNAETVMAASVVLSVFAAVAALGTSLVLGVGFERLRAGFETIAKQTGFFSDMLHRLEKKVEVVDGQAAQASKTVRHLELKVDGITEQTNLFAGSIKELAEKVGCMDSLPKAQEVKEPDNSFIDIQHYFKSDARNVLLATSKEKELEQQNILRARMHAIAKEVDGPAHWQKPVNDLSRRQKEDETSQQIHFH